MVVGLAVDKEAVAEEKEAPMVATKLLPMRR